jgi:hypothetical protein
MTVDNKLINNALFFSQTSKRKVQDTGELSRAIFSYFFGNHFWPARIRIRRIPNPDPDPRTQLNPDLIWTRIRNTDYAC